MQAIILAEPDMGKQSQLRRTIGNTADYFVSSVDAITEKGEFCLSDQIGNRVGGVTYGGDKVLIISGVNKIVKEYV